jgi:hypothetical protein
VHTATRRGAASTPPIPPAPHTPVCPAVPPGSFDFPGVYEGGSVPLPPGSLLAALPALTELQLSCCQDADVSGLTGLRRLGVRGPNFNGPDVLAVEGLSDLTALEDLCLEGDSVPWARPSDLAPLTALTRLATKRAPPELGSLPATARLRRLELQAFGGGGGFGVPEGAAAAALAALARGAPLLERLHIRVDEHWNWKDDPPLLLYHPGDDELCAPLGPGVAWPSLTHLEVPAWAALLLAGCAFPRLSMLAACIVEAGEDSGVSSNERLRTAVAALAAKAQDHAALLIDDPHNHAPDAAGSVLAAAAAVSGLRHLSWERTNDFHGIAAPPPGDWARLAASLESLHLMGPLAACGYAEPLAALTGLTHLFLAIHPEDEDSSAPAGGACEGDEPPVGPAGSAAARTARALARLPRLAHLRVTYSYESYWGCPAVATELARCPALRLLEFNDRYGALWRHKLGPLYGPGPRVPLPSPLWPPFAEALRAGGFSGEVRPLAPLNFGIEI